jgi:phenylacetate-coenzyme A ligase PaaK-like adenylate-forming protein
MSTKLLQTKWQSLPEKAVRRLQAAKLRHYLGSVVLPFSPYYRELFRRQGLTAEAIRSLDDLERVPFTSKADLLSTPERPQKYREFVLQPDAARLARRPATILRALVRGGCRVREELEAEFRPVFLTSTTGRSAEPVPFLFTRHDLALLRSAGRRLFEVCGAQRDYRLLNLFPYAPHLAFWQTHYGGEAFGVMVVSSGGGKVMGTEGNLRLLQKLQPDVLIGMPTFLYHLLHQAAEEELQCRGLKRIVLGGEKVPEGLRRKLASLARALGTADVSVIATYGFTEAKAAWAECPFPADQSPSGYHLYPDHGILEVIDPRTGEVRPPGQPGELVYTPLDARGSVVLRYRTGDLIDGGLSYAPCPYCGRCGPRLVGRISRNAEIKEMQLDKIKGTLVDFNQLEHVLDDLEHVAAWQLEIRKHHDDPLELDKLILHVAWRDGVDEEKLVHLIHNRFAEMTEIRPNHVVVHSLDEMRERLGVGTQLKERKIVDNRPKTDSAPGQTAPQAVAVPAIHSDED